MKRSLLTYLLLSLTFIVSAQVRTAQVDLVVDGTAKALPWLRENNGQLFYTLDGEYASGTELRFESRTEGYGYQCLLGVDSRKSKLTVLYCGPAATIPVVLEGMRGRHYLCLIYSDKPIDADRLRKRYTKAEGNFYSRVEMAMKEKRAAPSEVRYIQNRLGLTSYSEGMVPLYIEVDRR